MNDKIAFRIIAGVTVAVPGVVLLLYLLPKSDTVPDIVKHCPLLNATLNGTCTLLLISSYLAIRNKKINLHKRLNITAFILSALFLVSYIAYHLLGKETLFPKDNPSEVYLFIYPYFSISPFRHSIAHGATLILSRAYQPVSSKAS